jgi:hypothetical protein
MAVVLNPNRWIRDGETRLLRIFAVLVQLPVSARVEDGSAGAHFERSGFLVNRQVVRSEWNDFGRVKRKLD